MSQCPHCRGLRKSRTTHAKCDCGDKKKDHHHGVDGHGVGLDNGESKCRCIHGQRCTCALKKDHLDTVPETGLPLPHTELRKPPLTSTKSESTLTVFRDGHHKPMHKHNDMAHKCGLPYTIPRSHTIHGTSELAQRSADHLPLNLNNKGALDTSYFHPGADLDNFPSRRAKSEHGSPELVAIPGPEQFNPEIPPLDLTSLSALETARTTESLNPYILQDPYQDSWLASPDTDFSVSAGAFNAPPVDWSSFPLPSTGVSTSVSQAPSYASFDLTNNVSNPSYPGLTGSSSGEASEVEDFGPMHGLPTANNDLYDLHSISDGSDVDQYRLSSASSFAGLPQARLLASNNLESINIDDFLRSANESTAALEQQLQATLAMETKPVVSASPQGYAIAQSQPSYASSTESISPATDATQPGMGDMLWASSLFDNSMPPSMPATTSTAEDPFTQPPWAE